MKNKTLYLISVTLMLTFLACERNEKPFIEEPFDFNTIDSEPAWSPCGQWIAFVHSSMPNHGIYLISPSGDEIRLWHQGIASSPAWSPCGQWIAFSENAQIWKKRIDRDSLTQLTFEGRNFDPTWSSNNNLIAYRRSYSWPEEQIIQGLWVLDLSLDTVFQVFSGNCGSPIWLSSDSNLGFFRGIVDEQGRVTGSSFYELFLETLEYFETVFIPNVITNRYPRFSLVSNRIAFTSQSQSTGLNQIWIMRIDGTNLKQLTENQSYSCDWSPCGSYIVYTDARSVNGRLWIMNADGSNKRQLTFEHHF